MHNSQPLTINTKLKEIRMKKSGMKLRIYKSYAQC